MFEEKEIVPYLPRFVREEEAVSGTARGSAYHKALEIFPLNGWYRKRVQARQIGKRWKNC